MAGPFSPLPEEVSTCLKNARFLHLATCNGNIPHVSLMHFSYLPPNSFPQGSSLPSGPTIIMTSDPRSKKTNNLTNNPNVSLLVHDWVSSRPPTNAATGADRERSPAGGPRSSLAQMLMQMNSAAVSSISATINGSATVLEKGSEEERWCKEQHLANNTFEEAEGGLALSRTSSNNAPGDGGRGSYIEDEDVRVVVVQIRDGRISDWKGGITEWAIEGVESITPQESSIGGSTNDSGRPLVNGLV